MLSKNQFQFIEAVSQSSKCQQRQWLPTLIFLTENPNPNARYMGSETLGSLC